MEGVDWSKINVKGIYISEEFDLKDVVNDNILFFEEIAKSKNITLYSDLTDTPIYMDKYSANMIINNLISNAIKYSRKRKNIEISLQNDVLSVKDEGIGMSQVVQDSIFIRYKRGTKEEGGFGIGLDIVSSVCKDYSIEISVSSKENEGSSFILDFKNVVDKATTSSCINIILCICFLVCIIIHISFILAKTTVI